VRIRTVKPELWQDEDLAEVSEPTLILAIGLLNHADDEGYFRANPALIKAAIFPLREPSVSIHGMLTELSNIDYVRLFEGANGKQYGQICGFMRHQKINRPSPSKIKPLDDGTELSVNDHGELTHGREQGTGNREQGVDMSKPSVSPCPHEEIIKLYHEKLPELQTVIVSRWKGSKREKVLQTRWREDERHQDMQFWDWFFSTVRTNPHWMGENGSGWRADLGWLLERRNFDKVIERGASRNN